jgi:hypothetical protein
MDSSERPVQEWRKQSFDFASDSTKQLITIATGVVTATVLFSKDLDSLSRWLALAAWIVLTISVLSGVAALLNMSGNLNNAADGEYPVPSVNAYGIKFFSRAQIAFFGLGIILVFIFGFFAVRARPAPDNKAINVTCVTPPCPQSKAGTDVPGGAQPITTQAPCPPHKGARALGKCRCSTKKP